MRRLLRDVAEGRDLGDTTTLADANVVDEIRSRAAIDPPGGLNRLVEGRRSAAAVSWQHRLSSAASRSQPKRSGGWRRR